MWLKPSSLFFVSGVMPREWNATALTLVPKIGCRSIKDYRSIACCNVTYKCITKILATGLLPILPHVIDKS